MHIVTHGRCRSALTHFSQALCLALLFGSGVSQAQTMDELSDLLDEAGVPETVTISGGSGSIKMDFEGCTPMSLDSLNNMGSIGDLQVTLNTGTLAASVDVKSTLGDISVSIDNIGADPVTGTWSSSNLDNNGTAVSANGNLDDGPFGSGDVVIDSVTEQSVTLSFIDIRLDTMPGSGTPCTDVVVIINATLTIDLASLLQGLDEEVPTAFKPASEVVQGIALTQFANNYGTLVPGRINRVMSKQKLGGSYGITPVAGGMMLEGQSGGDGYGYPFGLWASYQHSDFEDSFAATAFDADSDTVVFGADFSPWDNFIAGAAFGYTSVDATTFFNTGEAESDTFSIIPYLGASLSDQLGVPFDVTFDLSFGFSGVDIDQFRTGVAGQRITSSTDSDRVFIASNLSAAKSYGNWYLGGRFGLLWARDDQDGFVESNGNAVADQRAELGRLLAGVDVAYLWRSFEPFGGVTYQNDFSREQIVAFGHPNDDDDFLVNAGLRWYGETVSAAFEYNTILDRDEFDSDSYMFTIRGDF